MIVHKFLLLAATLLVSTAGFAEDAARIEAFRQQLHKDLPLIYEMDPAGRHDYLQRSLDGLSREARRDFKAALGQFRLESGITNESVGASKPVSRAEKAAMVAGTNNTAAIRAAAGTITYDTGTGIGVGGIASNMVGNRFDSALNPAGTMCCFPVMTSGSITMITFDMVATFFSSAVWSLYSNVMGATAMQVTSMGRGVMTGLNTLSVMSPTTANAYMNTTFLAGIFQFMPASTGLDLDSGTTGGQGFHAISIADGTTGTGLVTIMSRNAIFRITSPNALTPVELLEFTVDE